MYLSFLILHLFLDVSIALIKCIKDIFPSLRLISFISLISKYGGTAITLIHYL